MPRASRAKQCALARRWLGVCTVGLLLWHSALAQQWYVQPRARLGGFYEDNVRLTPTDEESSPGVQLDVGAGGGRATETTGINLNAGLRLRRYFDVSDLDTTDLFADAATDYLVERDQFGLRAGVTINSTLTSEESTTGRVQDSKRRTNWRLAPSWSRSLTERLTFDLSGSYSETRYEDAEEVGLSNFTDLRADAALTFSISPITQVLGQLTYLRFDSEERFTNDSDTYSGSLGVSHAFSETLFLSASFGMQRTKQSIELPDGRSDSVISTGNVYNISLNKRFEVGGLTVGAGRSVQPSGSGVLDTWNLNVGWDQPITARLSWSLQASAFRNQAISDNSSIDERYAARIEPRLRYALNRNWSIDGGYRLRYQKFDAGGGTAKANAVFITLTYVPLRER